MISDVYFGLLNGRQASPVDESWYYQYYFNGMIIMPLFTTDHKDYKLDWRQNEAYKRVIQAETPHDDYLRCKIWGQINKNVNN